MNHPNDTSQGDAVDAEIDVILLVILPPEIRLVGRYPQDNIGVAKDLNERKRAEAHAAIKRLVVEGHQDELKRYRLFRIRSNVYSDSMITYEKSRAVILNSQLAELKEIK